MINPLSTNDNSIADPMKKGSNPQNYKIVKCKYWEKDGSCRYGTLCTFAHGEAEIRTKADNLIMNAPMNNPFMNQMMMNPPYVDPNFPMQNMMNPLALGFDPNMMMAMQGMMGFPQGMDPSMMNMNQMNNPDFMMNYPGANVYQGYPGNINENGN